MNLKTGYGCIGDGTVDCSEALRVALHACAATGDCLYVPPGDYLVDAAVTIMARQGRLVLCGDGANVARLIVNQTDGLAFNFEQNGVRQRPGMVMRDIGISARGRCGTALQVSYGSPPITQDHDRPSLTFRDVVLESGDDGTFENGLDIESAWNPTLSNVFISGRPRHGEWQNLSGSGVRLRGMCVNAHLENVRCNFFDVGLRIYADGGPNTEGTFCSNCSMVGVRTGVDLRGNANRLLDGPGSPAVPRISTLTWQGGLIECRVAGGPGQRQAIRLERIWTALIQNTQLLAEALPAEADGPTFAVLVLDSHGVVVGNVDMNAWNYGLHTAGECRAISHHHCTFTNVAKQTIFAPGTTRSRSFGHVCVDDAHFQWSADAFNVLEYPVT